MMSFPSRLSSWRSGCISCSPVKTPEVAPRLQKGGSLRWRANIFAFSRFTACQSRQVRRQSNQRPLSACAVRPKTICRSPFFGSVDAPAVTSACRPGCSRHAPRSPRCRRGRRASMFRRVTCPHRAARCSSASCLGQDRASPVWWFRRPGRAPTSTVVRGRASPSRMVKPSNSSPYAENWGAVLGFGHPGGHRAVDMGRVRVVGGGARAACGGAGLAGPSRRCVATASWSRSALTRSGRCRTS